MYAWQELQELRKNAKELSAKDFEMSYEQNFETDLSSGKKVNLCEGGSSKLVTSKNVEEFIELVLKARFNESHQQIKWIQEGMHAIVPRNILNMLSWTEVEARAVGDKDLDPEILKKITNYSNCNKDSPIVKYFWEVFEAMS